MYEIRDGRLVHGFAKERVYVEAWGENSLRVRIAKDGVLYENKQGALDVCPPSQARIEIGEDTATIRNGKITARFDNNALTFLDDKGRELTAECWQGNVAGMPMPAPDPLYYPNRTFRAHPGGGWEAEYRMKAYKGEQIYGMGQYQDGLFDRKGSTMELAPRNTQASVPFYVSSRGYGMLWNLPSIGRVTFGTNYTQWEARACDGIDYWITCGDTPKEIERQYAAVTGKVPMMGENAMGFWQCKLRYQDQEELLSVAREYKKRGIPLKVIVIDFLHWSAMGNWYLDPAYWPDPEGMIKELRDMGVELAVSVWPTVEEKSENFAAMREKGYLVETNHGLPYTMTFTGDTIFTDVTDPEARKYVWNVVKRNYFDKGIRHFWLDAAEPEYTDPDFDVNYHAGQALKVANSYARDYARMVYEGEKEAGFDTPVSLIRCAWAGSQKYGALVWSGDIDTTWDALRTQVAIGQNMAMAGIPWWNTDIGGFRGGDRADPEYVELITRWFQWAVYCPVMRLHGCRDGAHEEGRTPPNEIWSYGEDTYEIMKAQIEKREAMRPYIRKTMQEAHELGDPVIRPLFYEFPDDPQAWNVADEHMFGGEYLVAPVMEYKARQREVYLPKGADWLDERDGKVYAGGSTYTLDAPITSIPVLRRVR